MEPIQLALSLEEVNTVLEALGQMPYARVYSLVAKIQQQATQQLQADRSAPAGLDGRNETQSQGTGVT